MEMSRKFTFLKVTAIILIWSWLIVVTDCCHQSCYCSKIRILCHDHSMSLIPSPKEMLNATELKITSSTINVIYRNNFIKFPNLKSLSLENNQVKSIHKEAFYSLDKLIYLNLDGNYLHEIANDTFNQLWQLNTLSLCYNGITAIATRALCSLGQLKMLLLDGNSLTDIGIAGHDCLDHLETLSLSRNSISTIRSKTFCKLTQLKNLNLKFNPIIHIAYDSLACLENLKYLNLQDIKVNSLHGNIFKLPTQLSSLYYSNGYLKALNNNTLDGLISLKTLDLTSHNIEQIDLNAFQDLQSLTTLRLVDNLIGKISHAQMKFMPLLHSLLLDENQIEMISGDLFEFNPSLSTISLRSNRISVLNAAAFWTLKHLKFLYLDGNPISNIGSLQLSPNMKLNICGLSKAKFAIINGFSSHVNELIKINILYLDLSNNGIRGHLAFELIRLQSLNLSYNEIKEDDKIDLDEKTMLLNLDLSGNRYRYLDASKPLAQLTNANRLQTLNISSNRLKSVKKFTFAKMESLRNLLVSSNQLQHLHFLEPLKTIKFLSVSENNIKNIDYADFSNLAELEHLNLDNNNIEIFELSFLNCTRIKKLSLRKNLISSISSETFTGTLTTLKTINLAENQLIKAKIFNQIAGFVPFLQELYLQGNQIISTLDMSFKTFSNLMILNLRNNNISNIGNLTDQKLLTLDLAGNQIKKLSCHGFPNSTQNLNLADNRISAIHSNCYQILKKLNYLDLSQNRLREDSKLIWTTLENSKELRILNIAEIAIYNLSTIGPFKNLHAIDVSFNPVVFSTLLKFISIHIPKLKKINASNCDISEIPVGAWSIFRLLSTVILNNNNLTTIRSDNQTKMSVTTLNNLYLAGNSLSDFLSTANMQFLHLKILTLARNNIQSLCATNLALTFPRLQILDVSNNQIVSLHDRCLKGMEYLSKLYLTGNKLFYLSWTTFNGAAALQTVLSQRDFLCCKVPATVTLCRPHLNPNRLSSCLDLIAHSSTRLFLWLVTSVSLLGNVLIWIRHYGIRNRRSNFLHMFLVDNLNLSNLCMILYYLIIGVTDLNQHSQLYGRYAENWMASGPCLAAFTVIHLSLAASATFTLIVSIHYFLLSSSSTTFQLAKSTALRTAGIIWLILLIFSAIPVIISSRKSVYQYNNDIAGFCMTINEHDLLQNYWVMTLTIVTSIAILLAGIICFLIAIRLVKIRRLNNLMLHTESNHTIGIQSILLFLVYFFSTLPYYVILFHSYISTGYINARLLQSVAFLSLPLNATISPFIYLFMSMKRSKKLTISRPVSVHPTS